MGWFSRQTEYLRLYTLMNFDMKYHKGSGVVRWESLEQHPNYSPVELRLILAALQYARTLVNHAETRSELFVRVGQGAGAIASGALQLAITPWELEVGGMYFQIWPWIITSPDGLTKPKTYVGTLQDAGEGGFSIHLKMAFGLERVLAPSAALLPLFTLSSELTPADRVRFGKLLLAVNSYYGSPDAAGRLYSEVKAVASGLPVLRQ